MTDDGDDAWSLSSTSTPSFRFCWDVFLSFRGEDTRENFTDRLFKELRLKGVRTFRDNEGLKRGDEISESLLLAIEDSAASIVVLSEKYASSKWCLEELAKIVECRRLILPVFYQVDPSDVRRQKGPFEEDFRNLELQVGVERVVRWKKAMEKVGGIAGWDSRIWDESQLIHNLVKKVLAKISGTPLGVAKYPVGLNSRLERLMTMLDVKANGVLVLGLYGMGGVGKTTLAKALYNKLVIHFKRRSFISNIREKSRQDDGLASLQSELNHDLSPTADEVSQGIISTQPVLVLLDDVDDVDQLNVLFGKRDLFCEGSRIIITSRDKEVLLNGMVNRFHEVEQLNLLESLQLFSYHAFGREKPDKTFMDLSKQIVGSTGGLPLALEVFGSFLFDKRRKKEWEDALQKLKRIRPGQLQDVLKISFDDLDEQEKCIFLDLACFFVHMKMKREDAIDIFKGCGFNAEIVLTVLTLKSLVRIIDDNILWMHDQLRDMGRQIVRDESETDFGQRSRLWDHDEIMDVLNYEKGTGRTVGITLDFKKSGAEEEKDVKPCTRSFQLMHNLRLLQINWVKLDGNYKLFPAQLKWLQWKGCHLQTLPSEFSLWDLAVLDLSESKIKQVWERSNKMAKKLLVMNLRDCYYLTDIPDLSGMCLEKLILEQCRGLVKIHKSVGDMNTLTHLNLKDCENLVEFPSDVSGLKCLETLILSGCSKLKELPEDMSGLKSLRELLIDRTGMVKIPYDIFRLKNLERFILNDCQSLKLLPISIGNLRSLLELSLDGSGLKEIPQSVGKLTTLEILSLRRCSSLTSIPDSVGNLSSLIELFLDSSAIKGLPTSIGSLSHLKIFSLSRCKSLSKLPDSMEGLSSLVCLWLEGTLVKEIPDQLGTLNTLKKLEMGSCEFLRSLPQSIGNILSLTTLNLNYVAITELPESIGLLERLEILKLNNCKNLQRLPASIGRLKSLCYLLMANTALTELPGEFGMLSSLKRLIMSKEPQKSKGHSEPIDLAEQESHKLTVLPMSFSNLSLLEELDARNCRISGRMPDDFEKLSSLQILNLGRNNFCSLSSSLRGLSTLKKLGLHQCKELKCLPSLPSSLVWLDVSNCTALEVMSDISNLENLQELQLTNCRNVKDIPGLECLKSLKWLYTNGCNDCLPAVKKRLSKIALRHLRYLGVPGSRIPDWFVQEIPSFASRKNRELKGLIVGIVLSLDQQKEDAFRDKLPAVVDIQLKVIRHGDWIYKTTLRLLGVPDTSEDHLYLCRFQEHHNLNRMLKDGDKIQVTTREESYFNGLELKKHGVCLVFENEDDYDDDDEELLDESKRSVSERLSKFFSTL